MTKLIKLMTGLCVYYIAGWMTVWIVAVLCGASMNIAEWVDVPRIVVGTFVAPMIGAFYAHLTEADSY